MKIECVNSERIVGYLYDDLDENDRRAITAHLAACEACREEIAGLEATRGQIALWSPPAPDLDLRVVRGPSGQSAGRRSWFLPAWGLAAAATLVLAAAAAIANIEVRYGADGLLVRTGWAQDAVASGVVPDAVPQTTAAGADLAVIERRLGELEQAMQQGPAAAQASATPDGDAELFRRVRALIADAEQRQQRDVAMRLAQVIRDFDRQRRSDIALIQQGFGQYQGLTNAEIAQQRDMLNRFIRVAAGQEK